MLWWERDGGSVSCGKSSIWGKVLRGPDCVMLELEREREEGKGRAQDIKSVCFGFFWFYDPGMVVSTRADDSCLRRGGE